MVHLWCWYEINTKSEVIYIMPMFTLSLHAICTTEEFVNNGIIQLQAACCTDYSQDARLLQGNWTDPVRFSAHLLPFSLYIHIHLI